MFLPGTLLVPQTVKNLPAMQETQFDPWVSKSPGGGNGSPLQYSCLENPMDRGASWATVRGIAKSRTRLSDLTKMTKIHIHIHIRIRIQGLSRSLSSKESSCNAGDAGLIPGWGRSPGEGNGNPLQYSCLENPMDRGAWQALESIGSQGLDTT